MSISKTLTLNAKLLGFDTIHKNLLTLEKDAQRIQMALSSIGISGKTIDPNKNNVIVQVVQPVKNAVKDLKAQVPEVKAAMNEIVQATQQYKTPIGPQTLSAYNKSIRKNARGSTAYTDIFADSAAYVSPNTTPKFTEKFDLESVNLKGLKEIRAQVQKELPKGYKDAYDGVRKLVISNNSKIAELEQKYMLSEGNDRKALGQTIKTMYNDEVNAFKIKCDKEEVLAKESAQKAKDLVKTAFGLHIAQMYLQPVMQAVNQVLAQMLDAYSQFDKQFANYVAKSKTYNEYLQKGQFYNVSIGETYGLQDAAKAAEKFASSGVDVAQNQEALTAVMQTATSAQMDYGETTYGVVRTMQAMHMQIGEIAQITDSMTNAANASTAELSDMIKWFEYAASSAYTMGLNVQKLSAYLGILSSTGLPGTGTAFRQLMVQLNKKDIQEAFKTKYSFLKDEDFVHIDTFISQMRNYVQSSKDQATTEREVVQLLQGKVNAQQALGNLLMAQPSLWNQVTSAANESGTTTQLYNDVTNNAADAIERIKNDINVLMSQFGGFFGPVAKIAEVVITGITKLLVALPDWLKGILGFGIIIGAAFLTGLTALMLLVGGFAILEANVDLTAVSLSSLNMSFGNVTIMVKNLTRELWTASSGLFGFRNQIALTTVSTKASTLSLKSLWAAFSGLGAATMGIMGATVGYMAQSELMHKQMYSEARLVTTLTSAWIALSVIRMGKGNPLAIAAGLAAGSAYQLKMQKQINDMERTDTANAIIQRSGLNKAKTYNVNIQNANITSKGMNVDDLYSAFGVDESDVMDYEE